MKRILLIQGHPDWHKAHFCHALASAYREAADSAGHETRTLEVARLRLPLLQSAAEWEAAPAAAVRDAQADIAWADHLVIFFPLWLGDMPAVLKGFFEQVLRPGFAVGKAKTAGEGRKLLKGKSARIVVTMGMPAFFYSLYYRAHSVKNLKRNILGFCGVAPVRTSIVGTVATEAGEHREEWIGKLAGFGFRAH